MTLNGQMTKYLNVLVTASLLLANRQLKYVVQYDYVMPRITAVAKVLATKV